MLTNVAITASLTSRKKIETIKPLGTFQEKGTPNSLRELIIIRADSRIITFRTHIISDVYDSMSQALCNVPRVDES